MNKQEVLEELETTSTQFFHVATSTGVEANNKTLSTGVFAGLGIAKSVLTKLEEPQKVKVPAFVAEWFEINKEQLEVAIWDLTTETYETDRDQLSEIQLWIKESDIPYKTLISMQDGYEVEEEPKYRVLFPCDKRKTGHQFSYLMKDGRQCYCSDLETIPELTESTIKSIDERYWPFAVPVEKV